jgi:hypothetical protein
VDYYAKRDNDPDGEVVAGVIYARGLVAHHLVKVGLVASLDRYYDDYGAYGNLVWRPFSELPPPDKPEKRGRDDKYKRRVQHKRLSVTMRAVERFLTSTVLSYYPLISPTLGRRQPCPGYASSTAPTPRVESSRHVGSWHKPVYLSACSPSAGSWTRRRPVRARRGHLH